MPILCWMWKERRLLDLINTESTTRKIKKRGYYFYIYRSTKSNKVYIGQSKHFKTRHEQHYNGAEEKFNEANFDQVIVLLFSALFNGSALNDVENQLIT